MQLFLYSFQLHSVSVLKCHLFVINTLFHLFGYVRFVVWVYSYYFVRYNIVHTELNIISNSLSSVIHIHLMKDALLSRQEASFKGLNAVAGPDLNSFGLWFAAFKSSSVSGDEIHRVMIRI